MPLVLRFGLKDLRRLLRDPLALALWLGIPVLVGLALFALFGREPPKPRGLLLIADLDGTFLSGFASRLYRQGKPGEMISVMQVPLEEGRRMISAGDASALLVIPKGFSSAFLRNDPVKLELVTNPAQAILPDIIEEITAVVVDSAWYLHQIAGEDLRRMAAAPGRPPDAVIADFSVRISRFIGNWRRYLDPVAIDVSMEVTGNPRRPQNIARLMFPSVIYMAVTFLAFGLAGNIWEEKLGGTLRRLASTPASMGHVLGGKLLALGVLFGLVGTAAMLGGALLMEIDVHNGPLAVLWIIVSGSALYLIMLILHTSAGSQRAAFVTGNIAVMVLFMLGGCLFPFEMMPDFLARIGQFTPNGWALMRMKDMLSGEAGPASFAVSFGAAVAAGGLMFGFAVRRLRRRFIL